MSPNPMSNVAVVFGAMLIGAPDGLVPGGLMAMRVTTTEVAAQLLDVFQKHGYSEVNTARMYANATNEKMLGSVGWQKRGLKVSTKIMPTKGRNLTWLTSDVLSHSPADIRAGSKFSLDALKTDKVDIYYLHAPDRTVPYEETLRELNKIYTEGAFARLGISNYPAWEVAQICENCKRNGWVMPSIYQGIYNAQHRAVEAELIPCLRAYGISFYVYNPLAGGSFSSRYTGDHTEFGSTDRFNPDVPHTAYSHSLFWWEAGPQHPSRGDCTPWYHR
ncbi:Aldo/keto reductase [Mycena sanguinolenta]|uniref:Aldo/keto reductase n=1 Tax=Mycena sanguinolenta TaxID=230812 RepID=A0A8H7CXV0_9AGAR|nr:Aldo/keto reductase [Mycena sanguinolenta]